MRILQLSDLTWNDGFNEKFKRIIFLEKPDLVVFAGDVIADGWASDNPHVEEFYDILKFLDKERIQTFFIGGNHDLTYQSDYNKLLSMIKKLGYIEEISGKIVKFNGLKIFGLSFEDNKKTRLEELSKNSEPIDIIVSHLESSFEPWLSEFKVRLILAGHLADYTFNLPNEATVIHTESTYGVIELKKDDNRIKSYYLKDCDSQEILKSRGTPFISEESMEYRNEDLKFIIEAKKEFVKARDDEERLKLIERIDKKLKVASLNYLEHYFPKPIENILIRYRSSWIIYIENMILSNIGKTKLKKEITTIVKKIIKLIYQGEKRKTIEFFDLIINKDPKNIGALYGKGFVLKEIKDKKGSEKYFDEVLKINPRFVEALREKAHCLSDKEDYQTAIEYYKKLLKINSSDERALYGIIYSLSKLNKEQERIEYYDGLLKLNPNDKFALGGKAMVLNKLNRDKEAVECCDKILKSNPKDKHAIWEKSCCFYKSGKYKEGIDYCDKILKSNPDVEKDINYCLLSLYKLCKSNGKEKVKLMMGSVDIKMEPGYEYFVNKEGDVARVNKKGKRNIEVVAKIGININPNYTYFLRYDKSRIYGICRIKRNEK